MLITDSDARSALAATRSLGRKGYAVITAGERAASLAAVSRYSCAFVQYPSPSHHAEEFVAAIAAAIREHDIQIAMPMTDLATSLLTSHRKALGSQCRLPFAEHQTIALASNKADLVEIAERLGVPTPRSVRLASAADIERVADLTYPIVIKPSRSRVWTGSEWIGTRVAYAATRADLERHLRALPTAVFPVLLQQRIRGAGVGFFACYDRGRLVASFAHKRVREKPPSGGVSTLCESTSIDPEALKYGTRLLDELKWHGVAMVEFKRDDDDGTLRLIEINARFWGSLQLAIDAGVDFPAILADIALGRAIAGSVPYRTGIRSRWVLGDLDAALMVLLRSRAALNLPATFPSRIRFLGELLRKGTDERWDTFDRDDPRPWRLELRQWLARSF